MFKKSRCWPCDRLRLSLWTHTFWCQLMIGNCPIFCSLFNLNRTTNQELSIIDVCTDYRWCLGNKQRCQWMWPVRSSVQITVRSLCQHGINMACHVIWIHQDRKPQKTYWNSVFTPKECTELSAEKHSIRIALNFFFVRKNFIRTFTTKA